MQVTGKEYKLPPKYDPKKKEADGNTDESNNEKTGSETWLSEAPLFAESGAKNAKEYAAYLLKYADNADGKTNKMRLSAANKQLVDNFLAANKDRWADMGINDQDVARIKSHLSQEAYDANAATTKQNINALKRAYNAALKSNNEAEKERLWNELEKLKVKMPKDILTPFDI